LCQRNELLEGIERPAGHVAGLEDDDRRSIRIARETPAQRFRRQPGLGITRQSRVLIPYGRQPVRRERRRQSAADHTAVEASTGAPQQAAVRCARELVDDGHGIHPAIGQRVRQARAQLGQRGRRADRSRVERSQVGESQVGCALQRRLLPPCVVDHPVNMSPPSPQDKIA
jgi:hypothetical protein